VDGALASVSLQLYCSSVLVWNATGQIGALGVQLYGSGGAVAVRIMAYSVR
jgi:hypothetical protein